MPEERVSDKDPEEVIGKESDEWSPRPFLRGIVVGVSLGLYIAILVFFFWLPESWRRWPFLLVMPIVLLQSLALTLVRPGKKELVRRSEYFRRRLGERWIRILTVVGIVLMAVGLLTILASSFFERPRYYLAIGLLFAGVLTVLPAGLATAPSGVRRSGQGNKG